LKIKVLALLLVDIPAEVEKFVSLLNGNTAIFKLLGFIFPTNYEI